MKRVWTRVTLVERPDGFGIALDDKPVRLPGGAPLAVPTRPLAEGIAAEWDAPRETVTPEDLPLTRLAGTAVERVAPNPAAVRASLLVYGGSDLLCYRATGPASLVAEQRRLWQPWLEWAAASFGATLAVTEGIGAIDQPALAVSRLDDELATHSPWTLAGLGVIVPALGSLVLGLAVVRGVLDPGEAHTLSVLDETWQEKQWGTDADAARRRTGIAAEIASAAMFVNLARS